MNKLQLVNDYLMETGAGDPVGSVVNQTDEYLQAVTWIADAWVEIQRNRLWRSRWAEGTFTTTIGKNKYTLADLGLTSGVTIDLKTLYTANSTRPLVETAYTGMRGLLRATTTPATPNRVSLAPDDALILHPTPDAAVVFTYEYFVAPVVLTADLDTPNFPAEYHKAIVWKAVENYAREQGKEWSALYQAAIRNFNAIYNQMVITEIGNIGLAPSALSRKN